MMNFVKDIHYYIHEYDFKYHDYLSQYNNELIDYYYKINSTPKEGKFDNVQVNNPPLEDFLIEKLTKLVINNYHAGEYTINMGLNIHVQDNNYKPSKLYHNHVIIPGNICAVFYTNIPKEGGEIEFNIDPFEKVRVKPEKNKIYLFPIWLYHRSIEHKDDINRICFNWTYTGNIRPIHKTLASRW